MEGRGTLDKLILTEAARETSKHRTSRHVRGPYYGRAWCIRETGVPGTGPASVDAAQGIDPLVKGQMLQPATPHQTPRRAAATI
jgi:hypothetical protein